MSVPALNVVLRLSGVALVTLLGGLSSAAAQTAAPDPSVPEAPEAPEPPAPEPQAPEAPAPEAPPEPEAPEAVAPEAPEAVAPEVPEAVAPEVPEAAAPAPASQPQTLPAPVTAPAAPAAPVVASSPPVTALDAGSSDGAGDADKPRMFGAMFDLGLPDGTTLSFVYRPIDIARVHAGIGYNGVSPGLRLGGEYLPLGWGPSIGFVLGHYFEGDANGLASTFGGELDEDSSKLLENVGYQYFALRAGMEFGGDRFTFFARGGVSWLRTTIHELDTIVEPDPESNTQVEIRQDPVLKAFTPTIQFGMIVQI